MIPSPSAASRVAATGTRAAIASTIFTRTPAPTQSGTTNTVAFAISSAIEGTFAITSTPIRSATRNRDRGGSLPTTRNLARGTRAVTRGHPSLMNRIAPSTLGAQAKDPARSTTGGSPGCGAG